MNLLVVAVGLAVGWIATEAAGQVIERRLVDETAKNVAGLVGQLNLPPSETLMDRLSHILGADVAVGPGADGEMLACSLATEHAQTLSRALRPDGAPATATVGGTTYHVGRHAIQWRRPPGGVDRQMQLYVLLPDAQIAGAKRSAARPITVAVLAAIGVATILAFGLSASVAKPIRTLASRMDRFSAEQVRAGPASSTAHQIAQESVRPRDRRFRSSPREVVRLAESFDTLVAELRQVQSRLAKSERLATLGRLSASVAHELRNPLSGIKMNARVLRDQLAAEGPPGKSIELIVQEIDRMEVFLDELLNVARFAGDRRPTWQSADELPSVRLHEAAEAAVVLLAGRLRHARVGIRRLYDPTVPAVRGVPTQVRQVIINLLTNAAEAMPTGGTVEVSVEATEAGRVRFAVRDTGDGIRVGAEVDVFDPFVTTKPEGVGLGLHICREIIESHFGRIGYDTGADGTTVWFELQADQ